MGEPVLEPMFGTPPPAQNMTGSSFGELGLDPSLETSSPPDGNMTGSSIGELGLDPSLAPGTGSWSSEPNIGEAGLDPSLLVLSADA